MAEKWTKMVEAGKSFRFVKGFTPWHKGTKGLIRNSLKGKKMPLEWRQKLSIAKKGKHPAWMDSEKRQEIFNKIAQSQTGEKHFNWKGGVVSEADKIRRSKEGKAFKMAVKIRDGYKCVQCGSRQNLQVDHIKPFSTHPELRFAIDNGRTLCMECHIKTDSYGGKQTYKNYNKTLNYVRA